MDPHGIARRRIGNSLLNGSPSTAPAEVVRRHLAMQAQDYGPAKWSIGQRSSGLVDRDVDDAVAEGSIVRTHVLRPTWHFVARDDIRWLLALSGPRVQQGNAGRYRQLGLDARTLRRAATVIASALEGGNRLTRDEVASVLDRGKIDRQGQRMPYILMHCELEGVIGSGGLSGKRQTYALLDERVPVDRRFDREEALVELTRRYLASHGPATVKDMSWWSGLTMADIREALGSLGEEVRRDSTDGLTLWWSASDDPASSARGAHLLQTYDELVVGYTESRFVGDPGAELARAAWTERRFPSGVVLLDGRVGGHWRRMVARKLVTVDVHLYEEPSAREARALEAAVGELGRFLELPTAMETHRSALA